MIEPQKEKTSEEKRIFVEKFDSLVKKDGTLLDLLKLLLEKPKQ